MVKDEGIILQRVPLQERKLLLTLFTKSSGVQKFVAKIDKRKNLSPLILIEFSYRKKENGLQTLEQYEILETFPNLRKNFHDIQTATKLLKTVHQAGLEGRAEEPLFVGLLYFLNKLPNIRCKTAALIAFQIRLLDWEGLLPESFAGIEGEDEERLFGLLQAKTLKELNELSCSPALELKWERSFQKLLL